jgi:glyoxylase-like metal-dependent hydrolase (beta-lactamase superfamily II)
MAHEIVSLIDTEALVNKCVAAYLVTGKERALIDMGYRSSAEAVVRKLREKGVGPDDLHYLLPTHVHLDHAGSCGSLARAFPNANVGCHPAGASHLIRPARLIASAGGLFGDALMTRYGLPEPIDEKRVHHVIDDETISLGAGITLRSVWTPGHAPHHLSYMLEESGLIFTGDAVGVHYSSFPTLVPTTPPPSFELDLAVKSLNRIQEMSTSRLLTPHFGVVNQPEPWVIENIRQLLAWNSSIWSMLREGRTEDYIATQLTQQTCRRLERSVDEVPEHLRVLFRLSTLGFVKYQKEKGAV